MGRCIEWDTIKADVNDRKHGIRFEDAALVFDDPLAVSDQDRIGNGEQRWRMIGQAGGCWLLLVAHTVKKTTTRKSSASFPPVASTARKGSAMNMVRVKQGELPPLTEARKAELKALAARPDSEIDYSDIPPLDDQFWARAAPNPLYKPVKQHASVRIEPR